MDEKELRLDTEAFLKSEYGKYITQMMQEMQDGFLSNARDVEGDKSLRYLDKSTAIQEVLDAIKSPLL